MGMAGYDVTWRGDFGAIVGSIAGSAIADKHHKAYAPKISHTNSEYEEVPETIHSSQRVNGGTVVETRNIRQRGPSYKEPK